MFFIYFNLYFRFSGLLTVASEFLPTQVRLTGVVIVWIIARIGCITGGVIGGLLISESNGAFILYLRY